MFTLDRKTLFLSATFLSLSCSSTSEDNIVARVNAIAIPGDELKARLLEYQFDLSTGSTKEVLEFKERVLNELIEEKALLLEAQKRKLNVSPEELTQALSDVEKDYPGQSFHAMLISQKISYSRWRERMRLKILLSKVIEDITKAEILQPSEESIQAYFKEHPEEFHQTAQVHLQQIVVKAKDDGEKILAELRKGSSFEELAKTYSLTPEGSQGGDLGYVSMGIMPKEIETIFPKLPLKQPSRVIQTEYGFHIVRVLERRPHRSIPLEEARASIIRTLTQKQREQQFASWKRQTLAQMKIERNHAILQKIQ